MYIPSDFPNELAIKKLESKGEYKKSNCDMNQLKKQQELLKQKILSNEKLNIFTVFDMECSLGKTYTAINTIPYYFRAINEGKLSKKGILIVLRETTECDKYEHYINELYEPFDEVSLAFHSKKYESEFKDTSKTLKQDLLKKVDSYPVVFITHENYLKMALDKKLRNTFIKNRQLLIIDEYIDICKVLKLEKTELDVAKNLMAEQDRETLVEICKPIQDKFEELEEIEESISTKAFNFKVSDQHLEKIKNFKIKIGNSSYLNEIKDILLDTLLKVECIYNDTCIINKSGKKELGHTFLNISTINRNQKMWTLDNNIILDASATLTPQYEMQKDLYVVVNNKKVLDHSKWSIEYILKSTTKASKWLSDKKSPLSKEKKEKLKKFYDNCSTLIKYLGENETLVVCSKDEHIIKNNLIYEEEKFNPFKNCNIPINNIEHFGNITGKRDYENLKNVLITHTYNYSDTDYILKYMYFSNKKYQDDDVNIKSVPTYSLNGIFVFKDKDLQDFKEKTIANHLYQAVCRVNREMKYTTKIIIISGYLGSILYVRDMLGCSCKQSDQFSNLFEIGVNKVNEKRKQNSKHSKFEELFTNIINGHIHKEIEYSILDPYIISITKKQIQNYLEFNNNKMSKTLNECKEFIKDNAIIYVDSKIFYIILNKKLNKAN